MGIYATQRNATRNQSTVDYTAQNIFTYGNRYQKGVFVNNLGETLEAQDGILVVRNAGSYETAIVEFLDLADTKTVILAGLTYTASGAKTAAQVAAAFADKAVGYVGTGAFSGTLTGYSTGSATDTNKVVFTASTVGNKTDLADTGNGSGTEITVINGTSGIDEGFSPATDSNLENIIGILKIEGINTMDDGDTLSANYCISGDIDASMLILPTGITLDTIVNSKSLKDILTSLGFVLNNVTEMTKFDN